MHTCMHFDVFIDDSLITDALAAIKKKINFEGLIIEFHSNWLERRNRRCPMVRPFQKFVKNRSARIITFQFWKMGPYPGIF